MEPDETLRRLRELTFNTLHGSANATVEDIAELVEALDDWITSGGFLPAEWER